MVIRVCARVGTYDNLIQDAEEAYEQDDRVTDLELRALLHSRPEDAKEIAQDLIDREINNKERLIEQIQQNSDVLRDNIKLIDFFQQTDQTERTSDPDLFAKDDDGTLLLIIVKEHVDSLGDIDQFRSTVEEYGGVDNAGVILVTPRSDGVVEIEEDWIDAYQI